MPDLTKEETADRIHRALAQLRTTRGAEAEAREEPPAPRILEAEHEVDVADLTRGAKAVASKVHPAWTTVWLRALSEELEKPKRGGEVVGVKFAREDGHHGWAVWFRGKFLDAFLYHSPSAIVPKRLKAKELKEVLAHG